LTRRGAYALCRSLLLAGTCLGSLPALAQTFVPQGAAPGNEVNDPTSYLTFTGSTSAIVVNPTTGGIVLGSVNGGIWTSAGANASGSITWTERTSSQIGLSIAALAVDPTNPLNMIAGIGAISNGASTTGPLTGVMTSGNGGTAWNVSAVGGLPANYSVTAAAISGSTLLVGSSDLGGGSAAAAAGLYRSTAGGAFTNIAATLPGQVATSPVTSLISNSANVFVAAGGGSSGVAPRIYSGTIGGNTWTSLVTSGSTLANELSPQSAYVKDDATNRYDTVVRLAAGPNNALVAGVERLSLVNGSTKANIQSLYYSPDNGGSWYKIPLTASDGSALAITTGGQGLTNLSIAVDPNNKNVIYIAGDSSSTAARVGAYYLPIYKLTLSSTYQVASVTDLGVLSGTYIHPDSRGFAFDQNGNLIVLNDGGIYTLASSTGTWRGLNGNLQLGEYYQVSYDSRNKLIGAAAQDNGVQLQSAPNSTTLKLIRGGDGINISFADKNGESNTTIYGSTQNLAVFRFTYDSATKTIGARTDLALYDGATQINSSAGTTEGDDPAAAAPFSAKFVLNKSDQTQFVVGTKSVYVGVDTPGERGTPDGRGAYDFNINLTKVGTATDDIGALAYGVTGNPNAVLAGSDDAKLWLSTTGTANSLVELSAYNRDNTNTRTGAGAPTSVVFDARTIQRLYAADGSTVWGTVDQGASFSNLSGHFPANFASPRALGFISQNGVNALVIGGVNTATGLGNQILVAGVRGANGSFYDPSNTASSTFARFGSGMPNAPVYNLYYSEDADVLVAGTFGRGAYVLYDVTSFFRQATALWFGKADNDSTPVASQLSNGTDENGGAFTRGLTKYGTGTLTIAAGLTAGYTGATTIQSGTMLVDGSIANSSRVTVSGGVLSGNGTVPTTQVNSGAALKPGSDANPTGTLSFTGNLTMNAGSIYLAQFFGAGAAKAAVTGSTTLAGALEAAGAGGTYVMRTPYTVLTTTAGLTLNLTEVSGNVGATRPQVSSDANNMFITLQPDMANVLRQTSTAGNLQKLGSALDTYVNNGGTLPAAFQSLYSQSGATLTNAVTQLTGENGASGGVQGGTQMTNSFLTLLLNPYGGSPSGNVGASGSVRAFAPTDSEISPEAAAAYAAVTPKDRREAFERRWGVWGQAYGGYNKTSGDTVTGAHDTTSRTFGLATGFDYRVAADTVLGFALAGGGTSWSLSEGLGSGRSDALQVGLYGSHNVGAAYVSGGLSYAWHRMTTDRTVTAGPEQLRASFNAQSIGGRVETGYRIATPVVGITPYAALQLQTFRTPAYAETAVSGAGVFALSYDARSTTTTRTELGAWFDKMLPVGPGNVLTLRNRVAWAHDRSSNPSTNAAFQSLPGASFTVNGAAPVPNSALLSAGAELRFASRFSIGAKFDGEFASRSQTYAGTATVRYEW